MAAAGMAWHGAAYAAPSCSVTSPVSASSGSSSDFESSSDSSGLSSGNESDGVCPATGKKRGGGRGDLISSDEEDEEELVRSKKPKPPAKKPKPPAKKPEPPAKNNGSGNSKGAEIDLVESNSDDGGGGSAGGASNDNPAFPHLTHALRLAIMGAHAIADGLTDTDVASLRVYATNKLAQWERARTPSH